MTATPPPGEQVDISPRPPSDPDVAHCFARYRAELAERLGIDLPPDSTDDATSPYAEPRGLILVATRDDRPVGCAAVRFEAGVPPEIKRLWVSPTARGLRLGRRLLAAVEDRARAAGALTVRLDTNRGLTEAIALYHSVGYREIDRYNDNEHAHLFFAKDLGDQPVR